MASLLKSLLGVSLVLLSSCDKSDEPENKITSTETGTIAIPSANMAIDLGLSVKWAPFNVGASNPTDFGNYYAWGEIEPKNNYSITTYVYNPYTTFDVSGTDRDVAHVKWGSKWRIPTIEETLELVKKCKWVETIIDGVKGMKVIGPSGNYIFLPAAGRYVGDNIEDEGTFGHYWQGNITTSEEIEMNKETEMYYYDLNITTNGLTIRPVWAN